MKHIRIRIIIITVLLGLSLNTFGQKTVPDFTVEDIYGHTHNLYSDYLEKKQYVLLDFFGVGCGPCQYITPDIDTVFQEFGCGYGEIAFLGIEAYNNNDYVWYFADRFSMNFPAISGIEGSGSSIFSLYNIDQTPYHIVISPEKEIIIDDLYINEAYHLRDTLNAIGLSQQACLGNDFRFYSLVSENDSVVGKIDDDTKTVHVIMPEGTDLSILKANFKNALRSSIKIDGTEQISGETVNDFSSGSLTYQITSEKLVTENWTIEVNFSSNVDFYHKNINIYPNPSKGKFTIQNNAFLNKNIEHIAVITDISGKEVSSFKLDKEFINIDISNQVKGIYILNIKNKHTKLTKKLVIY